MATLEWSVFCQQAQRSTDERCKELKWTEITNHRAWVQYCNPRAFQRIYWRGACFSGQTVFQPRGWVQREHLAFLFTKISHFECLEGFCLIRQGKHEHCCGQRSATHTETHTAQLKYQQNQSISAPLIEQCYTTQTKQSQQRQLYCNDVKSRELETREAA